MTFQDISLLIISALYIKAMSLFKTHAGHSAEQSSRGAQASPLRLQQSHCCAEKSQLAEETFSFKSSTFQVDQLGQGV